MEKLELIKLIIDFTNYYIDLHKINKKFELENSTIVEEFLKNRKMEISAETIIQLAIQEVEKAGIDVKLTQAIQKLIEAKELVSNYVDIHK
jgi:hypothetical protein